MAWILFCAGAHGRRDSIPTRTGMSVRPNFARSGIAITVAAGLLAFLGGNTIRAQPAQIILLRHAEKPDDKDAVHLSPRGEERARALAQLLGHGSGLTTNAPVAALFATHLTKHDHSHRTGETLGPLGRELRLPVETPFDSDSFGPMATRVLKDKAYRGKTVVICWTHHTLAQLAEALRVRPEPPAWKEKVFDRLWIIRYEEGRVHLLDLPQRLLKGDSKR